MPTPDREALPGPLQRCCHCQYFENQPALMEREIPGLRVMGSGYSSVRGTDGICRQHQRYLSGNYHCDDFSLEST